MADPSSPVSQFPSSPSVSDHNSAKKSCRFSPSVPGLSITPLTLHTAHLPTPPLTPITTPLTPCLKTYGRRNSYFRPEIFDCNTLPETSEADFEINLAEEPKAPQVILPSAQIPIPAPPDADHHLHAPLAAHLTLLHPSTPKEVIHFCTTRLLSPERPHGFEDYTAYNEEETNDDGRERVVCPEVLKGKKEWLDWKPVWEGVGDLTIAGLGREAAKGCQQHGPGKEVDERLEWMYGVSRRSWGLLEMKLPGKGDRI